jgi:tetratricopeptide (TPR) repeat protein
MLFWSRVEEHSLFEPLPESVQISRAHHEGRRMTAVQAEIAELELAADPSSKTTRASLIGYHNRHSRKRAAELVLEWIEQDPASVPVNIGRIDFVSSPREYATACTLWQKQVDASPEDLDVLRNASVLLGQQEHERARELLRRGEELAPGDPYWADNLGQSLLRGTPRRGVFDPVAAGQALTAFERAIELHQARWEEPSHRLLLFAANAALQVGELESAREHARAALIILEEAAERSRRSVVASRPSGRDFHVAYLVLGLAAVREGEFEEAERRLVSSATKGGGPTLNSFGPNMLLARELIDVGRCEAVLDYFRLCGEFWDDPKLEEWAADVEEGRTPNFGGNLSYCL